MEKRKTRKDCTVDMSNCPFPKGSKEYKTYRQKLYRQKKREENPNYKPRAKKKPPEPKKPKVRQGLCVCCKSVEVERDQYNNRILNGTYFVRENDKGVIIKAFACKDCI